MPSSGLGVLTFLMLAGVKCIVRHSRRRVVRTVAAHVPPARALLPSAVFLSAAMILTQPLAAQRVVMVHEEPRHRLVHETPDLRVLDVQIQAGDTTLFHTHDTPITYVTIGTSSTDQMALGGTWNNTQPRTPPPGRVGAVRAVQSYAERPLTHRVTNVGGTLFRLIAVPSRRRGSVAVATGEMPGEVVAENRWFRHATVTLETGEASDYHTAQAPTVLILTQDGRVAIEHASGWVTSLEMAGQSAVVSHGERYRIRNGGAETSHVVLVQVR